MRLDEICDQMLDRYGWSKQYCIQVAREYIRFMRLLAKADNLTPPPEVEKFWRNHLLNTAHYRAFCKEIYGRYIDYSQSNRENLGITVILYVKSFNQYPPKHIWNSNPNRYSKPMRSCNIISPDAHQRSENTSFVKIMCMFKTTMNGMTYYHGIRNSYAIDGKVVQFDDSLAVRDVVEAIRGMVDSDGLIGVYVGLDNNGMIGEYVDPDTRLYDLPRTVIATVRLKKTENDFY